MSLFNGNVKKLGFGLMRLPRVTDGKKEGVTDNNAPIDINQVRFMVDMFMEAGFTYFDTAWAYQGSEDAIKLALVDRYPRESFQLATKNAAFINCKTREDAISQFETSLKRTGASYFDCYLLHNLGGPRTHFYDDFDLWSFVREKKAEGKIKHYGFSFHSTPEELDQILTLHPDAEFVQLQINYADWNDPIIQSKAVYEVALKHNIPIMIMESLKGGLLANPPKEVGDILCKLNAKVSTGSNAEPNGEFNAGPSLASWGLKFCANLKGVEVVLSGMSNLSQMDDNINSLKDFTKLTSEEEEAINKAREAINSIPTIPCTSCNYCAKVCPKEVGISGSFIAKNVYTLYHDMERAKKEEGFKVFGQGRKSASECIKCGECEKVCPQHIKIRDELSEVSKLFH